MNYKVGDKIIVYDSTNYLTFIRLNERPYKIIKCKQSTLPDWF